MGLFDTYVDFREQNYDKLRQDCRSRGELFEDPVFPASDESLGADSKFKGVAWKRPGEVADDPRLFVDGLNVHDVKQGRLGNCWFVSAMAVVASKKGLWQKVIPDFEDQEWDPKKPEKYCGIFRFRFWRYGKWLQVVVDDRLPYRGGLIFVSSNTKNEFWSALLEKAYAKLFGSYNALIAGLADEALVDFTGGVPEALDSLQELTKTDEEKLDLFHFIERDFDRGGCLFCAGIGAKGDETEGQLANGLVTTHAYSVTAVREVKTKGTGFLDLFNKEKLYLVRLRNPWGAKEWNGAFSDGSQEWERIGKAERKKMGLVNEDDGEFWMPFDDFVTEFCRLTIVRLVNTSILSFKKTWHEASAFCNFEPPVQNKRAALANVQMALRIPEDDEILINIIQKTERGLEKNFGFVVLQAEVGRKTRLNNFDWADEVDEGYSLCARSVSKRVNVGRGLVLIVPFMVSEMETPIEFLLRVYTSEENKGTLLPGELAPPSCNILCCKKPSFLVITRISMVKAKGLDPSVESGKPDPYCVIKCEKKTFKTKYIKDTIDPKWNEDFIFYRQAPEANPIQIAIYNENPLFDDIMAVCDIPFDDSFTSSPVLMKLTLQHHKEPNKRVPGVLYVRYWQCRSLDQL